jgi:two-component system nitrogen regulation response regulator GlnG
VTDGDNFDGQAGTDVAHARPVKPDKVRLVVVAGPDRGKELLIETGTYTVGKGTTCDLVLTDGAVSRKHLEIVVLAEGVQIKDLGSTNGSYVHGARFDQIMATAGTGITVGHSELRVLSAAAPTRPRSTADRFGDMLGQSVKMREVFAVLERVAASEAAVLIFGETGTGKELVAEAIHNHSPRKKGPMVICDLGSLPRSLIESELFGHVRGAFTGADRDREGAFVQADKGTIFLDEIGEMDLEIQPRLLRALERRQVKPVGTTNYKTVDTRVVAATNRDLPEEVKAGRFREDLYHRLAVVTVHIPALRERKDDIPLLVHHFLERAAEEAGRKAPLVRPEAMAALCDHEWPGNVRELKNVMERVIAIAPRAEEIDLGVLGLEGATRSQPPGAAAAAGATGQPINPTPGAGAELLQFKEAKDQLIASWERDYLAKLIEQCGGNVSLAARRAGIDRVYLHRLMKKHELG